MAKAKDPEVAQEQKATDEQLDKERDVSAAKSKDQEGSVSESEQQSEQDEFREQQLAEARAQNMDGENAVPESRTPAFAESPNTDSAITQRQREMGFTQDEPMPKSAYDAADSDSRKKKTAKEGLEEALKVGDYIRVVNEDSPFYEQRGAITRLLFDEDELARRQGQPSQRFIHPVEFEAHSVGGSVGDQIMMLKPDDVERIDPREWISS